MLQAPSRLAALLPRGSAESASTLVHGLMALPEVSDPLLSVLEREFHTMQGGGPAAAALGELLLSQDRWSPKAQMALREGLVTQTARLRRWHGQRVRGETLWTAQLLRDTLRALTASWERLRADAQWRAFTPQLQAQWRECGDALRSHVALLAPGALRSALEQTARRFEGPEA